MIIRVKRKVKTLLVFTLSVFQSVLHCSFCNISWLVHTVHNRLKTVAFTSLFVSARHGDAKMAATRKGVWPVVVYMCRGNLTVSTLTALL